MTDSWLHQDFQRSQGGTMVDFGGGIREAEKCRQTAMREFIEEMETMYFSQDMKDAVVTEQCVQSQSDICKATAETSINPVENQR